jgi:signal transduction histidine kinase
VAATQKIAQESLANVDQHAQATHLALSLCQEPGQISLEVSDDGAGFDREAVDTGTQLGIHGMRERAELVGGTLTVDSQPGQGTTIRLVVPIEVESEE